MRLPPRPNLVWTEDGLPKDARVDDIYFSRDDGLSETQAVFLAASGLPERWPQTRNFTIAELGFGTGLNFLAAWSMWQAHRRDEGWLHFVSFEGFPLDREDVTRALQNWPKISEFAEKLLALWPDRAAGVHKLTWPEERISLSLHIGEIGATLPGAEFKADAWFLDGFSPARNPEMWNDALWPLLADRSAEGASVATFTVAGAVRRGLQRVGFGVDKHPGHGRKRERLSGYLSAFQNRESQVSVSEATDMQPVSERDQIGIIGGGIGGAFLAQQLSARGAVVQLFDSSDRPFSGASGNPAALVMPRLDAADTPVARLLVEAYVRARSAYEDLPGVSPVDVVHRPRDAKEAERFKKVLEDPPLGLERLESIAGGGLLHKGARIVRPAALIDVLLEEVDSTFGKMPEVDLDKRTINGEQFSAIVFASGMALSDIAPWLRLQARLGQVDYYMSEIEAPPFALSDGHYAIADDKLRLWGASFEAANGPAAVSEAARQANAIALDALNPYWRAEARNGKLESRAGIRATTPDRLPVIGQMPDYETILRSHSSLRTGQAVSDAIAVKQGVYLVTGFGSRGFTWAPWAADLVTAQLFGDPLPTSRESRGLVAPERQILRDLKRGRV